jgi:hypothetical protein
MAFACTATGDVETERNRELRFMAKQYPFLWHLVKYFVIQSQCGDTFYIAMTNKGLISGPIQFIQWIEIEPQNKGTGKAGSG